MNKAFNLTTNKIYKLPLRKLITPLNKNFKAAFCMPDSHSIHINNNSQSQFFF